MRRFLTLIRKQLFLVLAGLFMLAGLQPALVSAQPNQTPLFYKHSSTVLHVKFKDNSGLSLAGNNFVGSGAGAVNSTLAQNKVQSKRLLFSDNSANLKGRYQQLLSAGASVADLSQYYEIKIPANEDIQNVSDHLKSLPNVEDAYPVPLPAPPPTSPNYTATQLYRSAAPQGINANFAAGWPGGLGNYVKIADLEYSWNTNHEDLSKARVTGTVVNNGTPADPYNDNNHGTAVLGVLSGDYNAFGVVGLVPNSPLELVNTYSNEAGWDIANAVYTAAGNMKAGDVMIIEQQTWGPVSGFVPVEWIPEVYDAISYATAKNITVVEPAGNGDLNLDDSSTFGTTFPAGKPDSGAIIVGAGAACSGGAPARSRMPFSNYGSRVNLQGLGECVTSTGYGDLYNGGPNATYTNDFNGTSSATPIVAGAAASFISSYEHLNGVSPSPAQVRNVLQFTGSAQSLAAGSVAGQIGPLPNLASALLATDLKAPTAPTKLTVGLNSKNKAVLKWIAATDNVGVAGYKVYRNNVLLKTIAPGTTYIDNTVVGKQTYHYKLRAFDQAGHLSVLSNIVTVTTH